jgi:hypothetical protein
MYIYGLICLSLIFSGSLVHGKKEAKKSEGKKQSKKDDKAPEVNELVIFGKEMPAFHLMNDFKNGHIQLGSFSIPVIRGEQIVCRIDIQFVLQAENFSKSISVYQNRRMYKDYIYRHLYWLFDFIWEADNFHPDLKSIRENIKKAIHQFDQDQLIKDLYIEKFVVKNT